MRLIIQLTIAITIITIASSYLQYCPNGYFFDQQHCQTCSQNCHCIVENTCSTCVDGYTLHKGKCIQCPQANGIYGQCSGCCSQQSGTVLTCTDCTVVPGNYSFLYSGRCILSDGCLEVDSNGFCLSCREGYYQTDNLCYPCDTSCSTCSDPTNCLTCADGFYWKVTDGGLCTPCPNGCATCFETGQCLSCLQSYYKYTDHCLSCATDCLQCMDGSTCTICSAGIIVQNLCIRCTDLTYGGSAGCLSCIQSNNFIQCQQCDDQYFLDSLTGACKLCSHYITGAARCKDQNTPTQCLNDYDPILYNRYYLLGISCIKNIQSCKKIANIQGNCTTCYPGYVMNPAFACQQCLFVGCKVLNSTVVNNVCTCTECNTGYYLSTGSVVCLPCSTVNCAYCPLNVCNKCLPNYYLSAGLCLPSFAVANCLVLATATTCNTCMNPYYLGTDKQCYLCQQHCLQCTSRFTCTLCSTDHYLDNGACVKLPDYCYQYDSIGKKCILCDHGYYLSNGFCLQCTVESGTLDNCDGLCPIDYYIQSLLYDNLNFASVIRVEIILVLVIMSLLLLE